MKLFENVSALVPVLALGAVGVVAAVIVWWPGESGVTNSSLSAAVSAANLSSADNFAVLAGSAITNTGSTVVNGDIGLSPGTALTGFPPGTSNGARHVADTVAVQAKTDLVAAYVNLEGQTPVTTVPTELGNTTKTPGIYASADGTFGITGALTLDAKGDPDAVFIFKTASTLITAGASTINLVNGANACNVFWVVGSSATLGTNSTFKGNILALTSATLTTGASVEGSVLARNGAVTLDSNTITKAVCANAPAVIPEVTTTASTTVTAPAAVSTSTPPVVVTPQLPNTGFSPNTLWMLSIPGGLLAALGVLFLSKQKRAL